MVLTLGNSEAEKSRSKSAVATAGSDSEPVIVLPIMNNDRATVGAFIGPAFDRIFWQSWTVAVAT